MTTEDLSVPSTHPSTHPATQGLRIRGRRLLVGAAGGAAVLALAGAAFVTLPGSAVAAETVGAQGPHAMEGAQMHRADHAARRMAIDPAERAAHLAELAGELGVDPDALSATMEALRAEMEAQRTTLRESMTELEPAERRAAMTALAEERRAAMAAALEAIGIDPARLAELREEHRAEHRAERGVEGEGRRGPGHAGHRGGPFAQR
jgi:hypothetical protein